MNDNLTAVVGGSFKFKSEIDLAIEELRDSGVLVLAPETGSIIIPKFRMGDFNPLRSEINMPIKVVEDNFLNEISRSSFVYVINPNGYIGNSVIMEIGFALANNIPVFLSEPLNYNFIDINPWDIEIFEGLPVLSIPDAIKKVREG